MWRYLYKPNACCRGSNIAGTLCWQQLQSAFAFRGDPLADESEPPHAELCAVVAISVQARRGELSVGKSGKLAKHGNSEAACRDHDRDRIARQAKDQPWRPSAGTRQHRREHWSPRPLRQTMEHRGRTKARDHLRDVVVMTHGDATSQDHGVR